MGWAGGSYLAQELWNKIRDDVKPERREDVAAIIYDEFCGEDADDWDPDSSLLKDAGVVDE